MNESLSGPNASLLVAIPFGIRGFIASQFLVGESQFANIVARGEFNRKITLTAVAIKQFQIKENHWPEELNELTSVGLSASQWSVEPGVPIGYRVSEDSSAADLWAATNERQIIVVPAEPITEMLLPWQRTWNITIK